ncbi:50S ribosomal protein L24 [Rosistilla carotiformis]|uniref:Large ribosomal subunit protein uL24 n=1 Tax=Rosistilla carotiformis TaxID=2528017 RepID=A0A518JZI8_9BACT|nr:50S ribosomal protein L24 [Rosistilla carotiformis]QDV70961.1 50S ribosomal protein L24 [Rosistilla carotiformis]
MLIKVNDNVQVIAGADKGTTGKVLKVDHKNNKVLVEGVARVWKHVRKSQKNPQGGRLNKEMPIAISNVMIVCPQTGKPSRIGVRYLKDGTKERYAKASGASLGTMSPPRPAYAS